MRLKFCRPPEHFAHLNHPGAAGLAAVAPPLRSEVSSVPRKPVHTHRRIVKHGRALSR